MKKQSEAFSPKNLFSYFALGEAITWGLLIAGLLARELLQAPGMIITVVGATHGFMFLSYSTTAALVGINNRWSLAQTAIGVILAIVPFATVPYEKWLLKRKMLDGLWRRQATKNPKDKSASDRLFRWAINRPRTLVLLIAVFVIALFSILLSLGPPDQWAN
jgi:integral membrane protein